MTMMMCGDVNDDDDDDDEDDGDDDDDDNYCLTIWGNAPKSSTEKIFRLQKRAARIVLNVPKDSPSAYVFNQLKWMSLYQTIFYQKCLLMYCIINNVYPSYLHTYVKAHLVNHYNLRSQNQTLSVPFPHKEIYKKSFQYAGAKIWNNLPKTLKDTPNIQSFKYACKKYTLCNCSFYH